MSNYGYGGGQNPFDERNAAGGDGYGGYNQGGYNQGGYNQGGYNQGGYNQGGYGQQSYGGGNTYDQGGSMEMSGGGSIAFLNECRNIDREIQDMDQNLDTLGRLHDRASQEADQSADSRTNTEIMQRLEETTKLYRGLNERLRTLGSNPESQSPKCKPQFDRVKRSLRSSMENFASVRARISDNKNSLKHQYRLAYPDKSESEINDLVERSGEGTQVFTQALMQSNRTGQANRSLQALRARADTLAAIERQMEELVELFEQMNDLVVQQDVAVAQIEQKAEETVEHLDKGNEEIGVAVETARKTRKKKWICLGIVVLIIIIVAGAVGGYLATQNRGNNNNNNNNNKRSLLSDQLRGGPIRLVDRERVVPRVVGESNIKKWVEKTQRRGVVPTGMSTGGGDLNGDAFDLVKR